MADRGGFRLSDAHVLFARSPGDADRAHGPPVGHERDAAPEHDEAIGLDDAVEQRAVPNSTRRHQSIVGRPPNEATE